MDFAKNLLEKYGWKEGQGLGKHEDGISNPLKANFKFDQAGLGHNKADELNNHWWERIYNKAANNIDINQNKDEVTVQLKNGKSIEITTKPESSKSNNDRKNAFRGAFLRTATLTNAGIEMIHENREELKHDLASTKPISDEDLFLACNGRTAHKGARHGLNLSGKLSRIEAQEKELMEKFQQSNSTGEIFTDWIEVNRRKEKKQLICDTPSPEEEKNRIMYHTFQNEYICSSKKQRKKQKKLDATLAAAMSASLHTDDSNVTSKDDGNTPGLSKDSTIKKKKYKKFKKLSKKAIRDAILQNQATEKELLFDRSKFRDKKEFDSAEEFEDNSNSKIDADIDESTEFGSSERVEKEAKERRLTGLPKKFSEKKKKVKKSFKNYKSKEKKKFLKKLQKNLNLKDEN